VNDHISVIEENPMTVIDSFDTQRLQAPDRKSLLNELGDCSYLGYTLSGTDYKIIGDDGKTFKIEDY